MSVNISYIICLLVDKACCMTQCHDLSRGSIVSIHNMLQRQRNATFPIAVTRGILGCILQEAKMIQPCTVHLLQQECQFENIFLHQWTGIHMSSWLFFFLYEQRALFHSSNFPSRVYHRQSCTWEVVALHCVVAKGSQKRCNISRRPEY